MAGLPGYLIIEDPDWDRPNETFNEINEVMIQGVGPWEFEFSRSFFHSAAGSVIYAPSRSGFLTKHLPIEEGSRVLDFGTGSGILSIYAAKKDARPVVAIDRDPCCVQLAGQFIQPPASASQLPSS